MLYKLFNDFANVFKNTLKTEARLFLKYPLLRFYSQWAEPWQGFTYLSQKLLITDRTHSCQDPALQRWLTSGQAAAQPALGSTEHLEPALAPLCWLSWFSSKCTQPHLPPHAIQRPNEEVFVQLVLVPQDGALLQCHRHGCPVFGTLAAGEAHSVQLPADLKHRQPLQVGTSPTRQAVLCSPYSSASPESASRELQPCSGRKHLLKVSIGTFSSWT